MIKNASNTNIAMIVNKLENKADATHDTLAMSRVCSCMCVHDEGQLVSRQLATSELRK